MTATYGSLPFAEQIEYFRNKRGVLTESWLDVRGSMHDIGFMVAGANRTDLLADLWTAISKPIEGGATLRDFRKDFDAIVAKHGWQYTGGRNWRTRVIYETNLRQSYNAGRWRQLQRIKSVRPFWRYRHDDSVAHPRIIHQSWDGLVLHADDPWWHTHFPANGWGCQCYVEALNLRDLKRLGKDKPDQAPPINMQTVEVGQRSPSGARLVQTPEGIDPGFGYAPGRGIHGDLNGWPEPRGGARTPPALRMQVERTTQMALEKTTKLPAKAAAQAAGEVLELTRAQHAMDAGYLAFQQAVLAQPHAQQIAYTVGALSPAVVHALANHQVVPASAAIIVRDMEITHALRAEKATSKAGLPVGLTAAELSRLPALLRDYEAVLLDTTDNTLLFVGAASSRRQSAKVVVRVNYRLKVQGQGKVTTNAFRTASLLDVVDVLAEVKQGRLVLLEGTLK